MKRTRILLMLVETDERKTITIRTPDGDPDPDRLVKAFRPLLEEARSAS